ncbi:MAG: hypothetical protein PHI59_01605, partial [Candidatus Omnitrophica bacterium]|nr:hypothetical protein [Candidatus Omnitrophota bacterium]
SRKRTEIPFNEITVPKMGLEEMRSKLSESEKVAAFIKEVIGKHVCHSESLLRIKRSLEKELDFNKVLKGMGEEDTLAYVTGYIPYDEVERIREAAQKEKWALLLTAPKPEDAVPTLLCNPRWVSIIAPVFKLMESTPGYEELDISFWFLIFFSIFFGMLIGDAGVGLIFVALTAFAQIKLGKKVKNKSIFALFYALSSFAILWGILTATFFGQAWLSGYIKPLVPALRDDRTVQAFCFFLGATHLTIAHLWRAILKFPSAAALADAGWIVILWGGFFLAKMLILGAAFPAFAKWLFISGSVLVLFFTSPDKNILKGVGRGFGALLLNIVNSFTDVVSYIRLFAVGLAGVAIADAFNSMAMDVGRGNIFTAILAGFIIFIGQALNVILGPIAVLVHGVRLNVLEFCNHLDIKWTGFPYKPLKN